MKKILFGLLFTVVATASWAGAPEDELIDAGFNGDEVRIIQEIYTGGAYPELSGEVPGNQRFEDRLEEKRGVLIDPRVLKSLLESSGLGNTTTYYRCPSRTRAGQFNYYQESPDALLKVSLINCTVISQEIYEAEIAD